MINKLLEGKSARKVILEGKEEQAALAMETFKEFDPEELRVPDYTEFYDSYVSKGYIKDGKWDMDKLKMVYYSTPEELEELWGILTELRYSKEDLPTPYHR